MPDEAPLVAVLAAGEATRFGGGKLDAMLCGKRVGQWVVEAVADAGFAPGVIVAGADAPQFAREGGWRLLVNDHAADGLGTSLALAAQEALAQGRALLVLLADMPLVDGRHLRDLAGREQAATAYPGGKLGVPAMIGAGLLPKLAGLAGDKGAGPLLAGREDVARLDPPDHMLLDVDAPADLVRAEEWLSSRG